MNFQNAVKLAVLAWLDHIDLDLSKRQHYSQTFIRDQIEEIPDNYILVISIYTQEIPTKKEKKDAKTSEELLEDLGEKE